ncbi:MAG: short-chain dehydrogenase, partial [Phenylobacterium sp.]|nr:short-chain dehydrogenase [Phenylobacterium sp.]
EIATNYVWLHKQHRSAWTHELDLRPWSESW